MAMSKKQQYVAKYNMTVVWDCVVCSTRNTTLDPDVQFQGGCQGHGPDEYCYCGPEEAYIDDRCVKCNTSSRVTIS